MGDDLLNESLAREDMRATDNFFKEPRQREGPDIYVNLSANRHQGRILISAGYPHIEGVIVAPKPWISTQDCPDFIVDAATHEGIHDMLMDLQNLLAPALEPFVISHSQAWVAP